MPVFGVSRSTAAALALLLKGHGCEALTAHNPNPSRGTGASARASASATASAPAAANPVEARRLEIFRALDLDHDGVVTREEYFTTLTEDATYSALYVRAPASVCMWSSCESRVLNGLLLLWFLIDWRRVPYGWVVYLTLLLMFTAAAAVVAVVAGRGGREPRWENRGGRVQGPTIRRAEYAHITAGALSNQCQNTSTGIDRVCLMPSCAVHAVAEGLEGGKIEQS